MYTVCAAALVRNTKGGVLLVKRGVEPGLSLWGLPKIVFSSHQAMIKEGFAGGAK